MQSMPDTGSITAAVWKQIGEVLITISLQPLSENATLNDLYKTLKIPLLYRKLLFSTVNHKMEKLSTPLKDQDVISFFPPWQEDAWQSSGVSGLKATPREE